MPSCSLPEICSTDRGLPTCAGVLHKLSQPEDAMPRRARKLSQCPTLDKDPLIFYLFEPTSDYAQLVMTRPKRAGGGAVGVLGWKFRTQYRH